MNVQHLCFKSLLSRFTGWPFSVTSDPVMECTEVPSLSQFLGHFQDPSQCPPAYAVARLVRWEMAFWPSLLPSSFPAGSPRSACQSAPQLIIPIRFHPSPVITRTAVFLCFCYLRPVFVGTSDPIHVIWGHFWVSSGHLNERRKAGRKWEVAFYVFRVLLIAGCEGGSETLGLCTWFRSEETRKVRNASWKTKGLGERMTLS